MAARDFSLRWSSSGTLRSWIIFPMLTTYAHVSHMSTCAKHERPPTCSPDPKKSGWCEHQLDCPVASATSEGHCSGQSVLIVETTGGTRDVLADGHAAVGSRRHRGV